MTGTTNDETARSNREVTPTPYGVYYNRFLLPFKSPPEKGNGISVFLFF